MSDSHSSRLMISVSGIRGVVGQSLTPAHALEFVQAYAAYLWDKGLAHGRTQPLVLLARDTRTSGDMMRHAAMAALIGSGVRVIDLGISKMALIGAVATSTVDRDEGPEATEMMPLSKAPATSYCRLVLMSSIQAPVPTSTGTKSAMGTS